jgi:hypothetical protein
MRNARLECRRCGGLSESYARPGRCVDDRCNGEMVEVEYVRADAYRGAVGLLREASELGKWFELPPVWYERVSRFLAELDS